MKKQYSPILILVIICSAVVFVPTSTIQAQASLPSHALSVVGGYSKHGSGDFNGIVFGTEYTVYRKPKFSWNFYFRGSINDGRDKVIFNNTITGQVSDASFRFTTAGVQVGVNPQLSLVRSASNEVSFSLGVFGRYQSASHGSDGYGMYYPNTTGVPAVLYELYNTTPQETFSVGGLVQLNYNYTFNNNLFVGLSPAFQTDTNGDVLPQVALRLGKRL